MTFEEEIVLWLDADGFMGVEKHPSRWSTGNAVLETAIAVHVARAQGCDQHLIGYLLDAAAKCWYGNALHKNPGRPDQITHDDLIGFATMAPEFASLIANVGVRNGWDLSNSNASYWDAQVPPWIQSYYLASSQTFDPGMWGSILFWVMACLGAFTAGISGIRLWYLMVSNRPPKYGSVFKPIFDAILRVKHGSFKKIQEKYYGNADHILVRFA
jgi:hypothetical protein